jgi:Flp pilus assembly pilin Flp
MPRALSGHSFYGWGKAPNGQPGTENNIAFQDGSPYIQATMDNQYQKQGQGMLEYALVLALVAIVAIAVLGQIGPQIGNVFSNIVDILDISPCIGGPPCGNPPCDEPPCGNPPCDEPPCGNPPCDEPPCGNPPCDEPPCGQNDNMISAIHIVKHSQTGSKRIRAPLVGALIISAS